MNNDWVDLLAFLAILATGVALVVFGHLVTGGLTTACVALVSLCAAWRHLRKSKP
jgi:cytochrome bd-type quinol oxidase subunit 1